MTAEDTSVQTFRLEPERHIVTPTWDIFSHCKDLLDKGADDAVFNELVQLLEGTCQFEFLAVRRRIKRNFQTFSLAARGKSRPKRKGTPEPSDSELDEGELCFMEDLVDILEASHFRLLSEEDWATAQAEEFTFTMPVEVNWSNMDTALMKRFWAARPPEEQEGVALVSDRVLVFHRGITSMKARGKFIGDKIDLLVSYLIVHPFLRLYSRLPQKVKDVAPRMAVDVQEHVQDQGLGEHHGKHSGYPQGFYGPSDKSSRAHAHAKEVKRITLKALMPSAGAVFSKLFETLEIQEPGFKNVVVLYRRAIPDEPQPKSEKSPIREYDPRLAKRNIHVKRFDDIPMADTEMIFPDKRVYVKPIVLIQLLVTVILGLAAAITTFFSMEFSMNMILSILGVAGGRAYQVYYSASIARQQVMDQITEALYEQTMDAQEGVVYFLLDQMADQHIKEAAVAYFVLLASGKSMSHNDLDEACEAYLERTFGERVDFAIERSLPELLQDGMVNDHEGVLSAVPLDKAHNLLKEKWASFAKMQEHQHALESVFHHRNTRRTTTTTTETTDTTTTRIQRLSAQNKAADALRRKQSMGARSSGQFGSPGPAEGTPSVGAPRPGDRQGVGIPSGSYMHVEGAPLDRQQQQASRSRIGQSIMGVLRPSKAAGKEQ